MSLEAAARSVGPDVALRQADSVYQLSRQSTSDPDTAKVAKMRLAFSNHPMWIKTSNPKVTKENCKGKEVYRVGFLHQANKGTKNKPFKHSKRHASLHLAEASMFEVRFAKESKSTKAAILKVLSGEAEMEALPKKKLPAQRSGTKGKATTMRYDHAARSSNRPNRNPNGPGDMSAEALADRCGGSSNWMEIVQRSGHRLFLTKGSRDGDAKILREACESGQWWKLMPFGEDEEVRADATPADQKKLMRQAKCVMSALKLYGKYHDGGDCSQNEPSYTWRQACKDAVASLMEQKLHPQTVERWYLKFRYNSR